MPEIPEMELYKDRLNRMVKGKRITSLWIYREKSINHSPEDFKRRVLNSIITNVDRKGKYLIFKLSTGENLLAHMMLDGRLYYLTQEKSTLVTTDFEDRGILRQKVPGLPGSPSVVFEFEDRSVLFFCQLTLGYLRLYQDEELEPILSKLGPDPLGADFDQEDFTQLIGKASQRGVIKSWLMQQKNIAGVGNAYSNEALFGASLLPTRSIGSITSEERAKLFIELQRVLNKSIQNGGDMEEPFSPDDNFTGGFNQLFQVYDREGEPCVHCEEAIRKEEVGGRNAFFCPQCQH